MKLMKRVAELPRFENSRNVEMTGYFFAGVAELNGITKNSGDSGALEQR